MTPQRVATFLRNCALALGFAMLLTACQSSIREKDPEHPGLLARTPFSLAKKGQVATLDFRVGRPPKVWSMVALHLVRQKGHDPVDTLSGNPPPMLVPVRVRVARVVDGTEQQLKTFNVSGTGGKLDVSRYPDMPPPDSASGIQYALLYGWTGKEASMSLAMFGIDQPGEYRVTVETIKDQPILDGVSSYLTVEDRFNRGE